MKTFVEMTWNDPFVTNGEFNGLRMRGNSRPLYVLQVRSDARSKIARKSLGSIGQFHVSIGILMKFVINVTSRLGSLVARRNVLAYMGKSRCHRLNFAPLHNYTVCAI